MNNIEIIKTLINALDSNGVQDEAIKTAALALLDNLKVAPKQDPVKETPVKEKKPTRSSGVDHGKIVALHDAGWTPSKIADEMSLSVQTVYNHLKKEGAA